MLGIIVDFHTYWKLVIGMCYQLPQVIGQSQLVNALVK